MAGVNVRNIGLRNVLYVATMRNMVYAFDTDNLGRRRTIMGAGYPRVIHPPA